MTYLELVQAAVRECRFGIPVPSAVSGLTGLADAIARWVALAAAEIDNENPRGWRWMRVRGFTATLTVGDMDYSVTTVAPPGLNLTTFAEFNPRTLYTQKSDGTQKKALTLIDYDKWMATYRLGDFQSGQPTLGAMADADTLLVNTLPDLAYQIKGDFWKKASALAADADTPNMPAKWRMLIVWEAVKAAAQDRENATLYSRAEEKALAIRSQMMPAELEIPATYGGSPLVV